MKKNKGKYFKIEKETVKHIAMLSRLGLSEKELMKYQKDLEKILEYINKLKEVDILNVEKSNTFLAVKNVMREDDYRERKDKIILLKKIRALMPELCDDYLKVKKII